MLKHLRLFISFAILAFSSVCAEAGVIATSKLTTSQFYITASPSGTLTGSPEGTRLTQTARVGSDRQVFFGPSDSNSINANQSGADSTASADFDGVPLLEAPGSRFETSAHVEVPSGTLLPANAFSSSVFTSHFTVTGNPGSFTTLDVRFSADLLMSLHADGVPASLESYATSAFAMTITGVGVVNMGDLHTKAAPLIRTLTLLGAGDANYSQSDLMLSTQVLVKPGLYTVSVSQTNVAGVESVPEPASIASFALLSIGGAFAARRRRSTKAATMPSINPR